VGHQVTRLLRIAFGPIELGSLTPGAWREVSRYELEDYSSALLQPTDRP
jgi:16S rRNA U516 pseudouridylate synthase RsuA-like enzyme